jgi:hypothetical protein
MTFLPTLPQSWPAASFLRHEGRQSLGLKVR